MMSSGQGAAYIPSALQLYGARLCVWTAAVGNALFVYDLMLTSAEEYKYVWQARWSLGKILYLLVRYPYNAVTLVLSLYTVVHPPTLKFCIGTNYWWTLGGSLQLVVVQVIMCLRTAALYNLKTSIIVLVTTSALLSSGTILAVNIQYLLNVIYIKPSTNPILAACNQLCPTCHPLSRYVLLPMIVFDAAIFFMTLYKHQTHSKREADPNGILLRILYRDGFMSFAIIFIATLTNFLVFVLAPPPLMMIVGPILRSILGIACGRLLLNLRGAILRQSYSNDMTMLSTLAFDVGTDDEWADAVIDDRAGTLKPAEQAGVLSPGSNRKSLGLGGVDLTNTKKDIWEMRILKSPSS